MVTTVTTWSSLLPAFVYFHYILRFSRSTPSDRIFYVIDRVVILLIVHTQR